MLRCGLDTAGDGARGGRGIFSGSGRGTSITSSSSPSMISGLQDVLC